MMVVLVKRRLHQNYHHQMVIAKFSVEVHYPPPDEGELWHFKKANVFHIKRAINGISLERSFADSDKSDKIYLFNKTLIKIKNALSNFMPYETVEFDDRDRLLIHSQIKHSINEKDATYKNYLKNNKSSQYFAIFQSFQNQRRSLIATLKNKY